MERRSANKYPAAFVQKTYKELEAAGKADLDTADSAASSSAAASEVLLQQFETLRELYSTNNRRSTF